MLECKQETVPLRWKQLLLNLVIVLILGYALIPNLRTNRLPIYVYVISVYFGVSLVSLLRHSVSYSFTERYLIGKILGIPFRFIRWDSIQYANYYHVWKDVIPTYSVFIRGMAAKCHTNYGNIIYVTMYGCPRYSPKYMVRLWHNLFHPLKTACIWLPYATRQKYIDAFRKHYPDIEIQALDEWIKFDS